MLTEQEVARSWARLFKYSELTDETFQKAETLLEELRPESALFHRLSAELVETRRMHGGSSAKDVTGITLLISAGVDSNAIAQFLAELSAVYSLLSDDELVIRDGQIRSETTVLA